MDKQELVAWCHDIADTFELVAYGRALRCWDCGEIFDENESETTCPHCGAENNDDLLGESHHYVDILDYLDDALDIHVTRSGLSTDGPIVGAEILVAYGGPNIWIDTGRCEVRLAWWAERADYPISASACADFERDLADYCY